MARSPEEQAAWALQCYGCSEAEHRAGISHLADQYLGNTNMALGSILSYVQELISMADVGLSNRRRESQALERARQHLNRVKSAIFEAGPIHFWQRRQPIEDPEHVIADVADWPTVGETPGVAHDDLLGSLTPKYEMG